MGGWGRASGAIGVAPFAAGRLRVSCQQLSVEMLRLSLALLDTGASVHQAAINKDGRMLVDWDGSELGDERRRTQCWVETISRMDSKFKSWLVVSDSPWG